MYITVPFLALILACGVLVLAASTASGGSKFTLPFVARINATGFYNILEADQARAKAFKTRRDSHSQRRAAISSTDVTNAVVTYLANVGIGSPLNTYELLIDTGSSNTWTNARSLFHPYTPSLRKYTGQLMEVTYGSGQFSGQEVRDAVTISPTLVIENQAIGRALESTGFDDVDGILGLGPPDLTVGTLTPARNQSVPTVTDNLYSQGIIPEKIVGILFAPTTTASVVNGELTFGGTDPTKYTGTIAYTPVTSTSPASRYWGISQSVNYNGASILTTTAGIVDTGTTLVLLATDAYDKYVAATGASPDPTTGLLEITQAQYSLLQPLNFVIGEIAYALTPNAQIFPRSLNTVIGGTQNSIYLIIGDLGSRSGSGLDFINGYAFLERFYSVFDTTNGRVGFAPTPFTNADTN